MRIVVVMVGILVATIPVTALSPRLAYAQNATATSIPPEIVCKMEPTSAECIQPSNSGSSIPAPPSLSIRTTPSLLSPSSIPPEVECKLNPNSIVCLQLSKPLVSPPPPPPSITIRQLLLPASPIPPEILCKMNPNSVVCLQLSKPLVSPPPTPPSIATKQVPPSIVTAPSKAVTVTTNLKIGNKIYPINYQLTGTGNKIISIILEKDNSTLLGNIASPSNGTLTIQLPRNVIDSKKQGTNLDENYAVLVDGKNAGFNQIKNDTRVRTLAIVLGEGSKNIEIVGTHAIPEFGTGASAALLSVAIAAVVITASAKFGPKNKLIQK
jgi:hypothetical protein